MQNSNPPFPDPNEIPQYILDDLAPIKRRGRKPKAPTHIVDKSTQQFTFEEKLPEIIALVQRRRASWPESLEHILSYEDMTQNLLLHIFEKFDYIDQSKAKLMNYLNRLISNQIINKIRLHFGSSALACSTKDCPLTDTYTNKCGGSICSDNSNQDTCHECPKFLAHVARRAQKYQARNPMSLDDANLIISQTQHGTAPEAQPNFAKSKQNLHDHMKRVLTPEYYDYYDLLFIQHLTDEEFAEKRNYKSTEKRRAAGYKRISDIKKYLQAMAKSLLQKEEIIVF